MNKSTMTLAAALWFTVAASNPACATIPLNAQLIDQSAYALGSLDLNVIFIESDGTIDTNQEDWTAAQRTKIGDEIDQSVNFWEGLTSSFHPNARLDIRVNYVNNGLPVATGYEPINHSSTQDALWINDVMDSLGYHSGSKITNVRNFNQARRIEAGTHWATTMFVVNDFVDADNRFTNETFAYAHIGGPYTMFTYGNNGWGTDRFDRVLSHELGHIFFGLDEYAKSGARTTEHSGYLNASNGNAERDGDGKEITPPQPNALMINNVLDPSPFTLAQVGIVDTDGDSIPDILDTTPILAGDRFQSDPASGTFVFDGSADVSPLNNLNTKNRYFSNSGADMTINWIDTAEFNLDETGWQSFDAVDGDYDDYSETLQFILPGLPAGEHHIAVRAINSVGNPSATLDFSFESAKPVPEPSTLISALLAILSAPFATFRSSRSRGQSRF